MNRRDHDEDFYEEDDEADMERDREEQAAQENLARLRFRQSEAGLRTELKYHGATPNSMTHSTTAGHNRALILEVLELREEVARLRRLRVNPRRMALAKGGGA